MATKTAPVIEPVIHEGVMEVLQRHDCVAEFWDRVALARECFPDACSLESKLTYDPDDDEHIWVGLEVTLPERIPWEQWHPRYLDYIAKAAGRFPKRMTPTFPLHVRFRE
jgi:hypothetical protein